MPAELRQLYAYNGWANDRILAACAELSDEELGRDLGSSFPSVRATLAHILSAEWIWLERWSGHSPAGPPDSWDLSALPALVQRWAEVGERQRGYVQALSPDDLHRIIDYRNTQGTPFAAPLWQLLRHVPNHSTYHRGQAVTMLRQLGAHAPATDLVLYYRQQSTDPGSGGRDRP